VHDRAKRERGTLGADAILLKPYDIEDLVAVVSNVCANNGRTPAELRTPGPGRAA